MSDWVGVYVVMSLLSLLTVAGYMLYSGLLSDVTILTGCPPMKKITFAYKLKRGPYKNHGQLLKESHIIGPKLSRLAVFYDDPKKVPGPQCRYAVGSILSEGENKADEELLKSYETSGFNVFSFPEVTHVVTTSFPRRTIFSVLLGVRRVYPRLEHYIKAAQSRSFFTLFFHLLCGVPWRVERWCSRKRFMAGKETETWRQPGRQKKEKRERRLCAHPFLEIYREGQIQFMAPLARQGDFYVPEVRRVERRLSEQEELHSDTDLSGADSNSEYSSGSGVLLSDSREASPATDNRGRSSRGTSIKELDWEQTGGRQAERVERRPGDADPKSLQAPTQEWWGAVGGEE